MRCCPLCTFFLVARCTAGTYPKTVEVDAGENAALAQSMIVKIREAAVICLFFGLLVHLGIDRLELSG
jgi:hypothetical protein